MKRQLLTLCAAAVVGVSLTAAAFAEAPATQAGQADLVATLEKRVRQLEWAAQGTKGAHRAQLEMRSLRLKKLIKRIEAGEAVDPQEIDALLQKPVHSVD